MFIFCSYLHWNNILFYSPFSCKEKKTYDKKAGKRPNFILFLIPYEFSFFCMYILEEIYCMNLQYDTK